MNPLISAFLGSFVRHALSVGGAFLVAHGIGQDAAQSLVVAAQPVLLGGVSILGSLIWSLFQKKKTV